MAEHERLKEILPAYALGAATAEDERLVRSHLDSCASCTVRLGMLLTTAAELEGDRTPPAGVWDRIAVEIGDVGHVTTVTDLGERRRSRWELSLLAGVAAAVALVFAGFMVARLSERDPLGDQAILAAVEHAVRQEGAIVTGFVVDEATVAEIILTADGKGFIIPADSLSALDESRTYQLWVINTAEAAISAGVLGSNPAPAAFTWTGDVAGLALTREVAGGVVSSEGDVVSVVTDL